MEENFNKRFVVIRRTRWPVCDQETGREILHCGSESMADGRNLAGNNVRSNTTLL